MSFIRFTATSILDIARTLLGLRTDLNRIGLERRVRIADYVDSIVICLDTVVEKKRQFKSAAKELEELKGYLDSLTEIIHKGLKKEKAERFFHCLYDIGFGNYSPHELDNDAFETLATLEKAAGRFKALANFLRV